MFSIVPGAVSLEDALESGRFNLESTARMLPLYTKQQKSAPIGAHLLRFDDVFISHIWTKRFRMTTLPSSC